MVSQEEFATKADLREFKEEIIHEFRVVSERWMDHIRLLAEGHSRVVQRLDHFETRFDQVDTRLDRIETKLDHIGKENERQHIETRSLIKLSFAELDKRLSDLQSQVKELQEGRRQVQSRLPF